MESAIVLYRNQLDQISDVCQDPWFAGQLADYRSGSDAAWKRISGSCLKHVFDTAQRLRRPQHPVGLLDLVQEGNFVLTRTIQQFEGDTATRFLDELTRQVERRLLLVVEHPELLGDWSSEY